MFLSSLLHDQKKSRLNVNCKNNKSLLKTTTNIRDQNHIKLQQNMNSKWKCPFTLDNQEIQDGIIYLILINAQVLAILELYLKYMLTQAASR